MMTIDLNLLFDETADLQILTARMRNLRNRLLAQSDWTQLADAPCDREAWATYRQALRDFPANWTPGPTVTFPDTP